MVSDLKAGDRVRVLGELLPADYIFLGTDETLYPDWWRKESDRVWIKAVENGSVYTTKVWKLEAVSDG